MAPREVLHPRLAGCDASRRRGRVSTGLVAHHSGPRVGPCGLTCLPCVVQMSWRQFNTLPNADGVLRPHRTCRQLRAGRQQLFLQHLRVWLAASPLMHQATMHRLVHRPTAARLERKATPTCQTCAAPVRYESLWCPLLSVQLIVFLLTGNYAYSRWLADSRKTALANALVVVVNARAEMAPPAAKFLKCRWRDCPVDFSLTTLTNSSTNIVKHMKNKHGSRIVTTADGRCAFSAAIEAASDWKMFSFPREHDQLLVPPTAPLVSHGFRPRATTPLNIRSRHRSHPAGPLSAMTSRQLTIDPERLQDPAVIKQRILDIMAEMAVRNSWSFNSLCGSLVPAVACAVWPKLETEWSLDLSNPQSSIVSRSTLSDRVRSHADAWLAEVSTCVLRVIYRFRCLMSLLDAGRCRPSPLPGTTRVDDGLVDQQGWPVAPV